MSLPDRVQVWRVPKGYPGTKKVVRLIGNLIEDRSKLPQMRERFRSLTRDLPSGDWLGEVARVWERTVEGIRYQRDPVGMEHLTDPVDLDAQIDDGTAAEDCESIAAYAATVLRAGGTPSFLLIHGRPLDPADKFRHMALVVTNPAGGQGVLFDGAAGAVLGRALGDVAIPDGAPVEVWTTNGRRIMSTQRDGGALEAAFGDVAQLGLGADFDWEAAARAAAGAVQAIAPAFGPYGAAVGGIVGGVVKIVDTATGRPVNAVRIPPPPPGTRLMLSPSLAGIKKPPATGMAAAAPVLAAGAGLGLLALLLG